MKNIRILSVIIIVLVSVLAKANTGIVSIENFQISGSVLSWDVYFERTGEWTSGLLTNALGWSSASFDFNNLALSNPSVIVESGGPLDNANYSVTAHHIIDKCIIDIQFSLTTLAGVLPLNVKTKMFTINMNVTNSNLSADINWDALNTGFFDNADQNVYTTLEGSFNSPLPVELTSFTGNYINQMIVLNWKTETEINNYGFDIERKGNNSDWVSIGFVSGYGNSNSAKEYHFNDNNLYGYGNKLQYRLKQIDNDGTFKYSDIVEVDVIPTKFELSQNYPNPFNPSTNIRISVPQTSEIKLSVYNILGEEVATLLNGAYEAGFYLITFNAQNLPNGTYFYRIEGNNFTETKKMILIK